MRTRIAIAAVALIGSGCGNSTKATTTVGIVISTSGDDSPASNFELFSIQMAVEQINKAGGVLGTNLAAVNKNPNSDLNTVTTYTQDWVNAGVPAIMGGIVSIEGQQIVNVTSPAMVPFCTGAASSPDLSVGVPQGYFSRTVPTSFLQGKMLAKRANEAKVMQAAIIHKPGGAGNGTARGFTMAFAGTVSDTIEYDAMGSDATFRGYLDTIYSHGTNVIMLNSDSQHAAQILDLYNTYYSSKNTFWYFSDSLKDDSLLTQEKTGWNFQHEGTTASIVGAPHYQDFANQFQTEFNLAYDEGSDGAQMYDCVFLLALAMTAGNKIDRPTIAANIQNVSHGKMSSAMQYGPAQIADALAAAKAGMDINWEGATGSDDLGTDGELVTATYDLWNVSNGQFNIFMTGLSP